VGGNDVTGTVGLQKIDYSYNIRGWLKSINDINDLATENDLFAYKIDYNNYTSSGTNDTAPDALYNGNISATYWRTANDAVLRKYNYSYDHLNRLTDANYLKPETTSSVNSYWENISYDKNGNIQTLKRNGDLDADNFAIEVDDLTYSYNPQKKNQLMKVFDASNHPFGFNDDSDGVSDTTDDYTYDVNGNMTSDTNKGITAISYNHLNLPVEITFGTSAKIGYLYNAAGQKVQKHVISFVSYLNTATDYLQGFQYTNAKLSFFPHAEGYVNVTQPTKSGANVYNYVFNYTDHLGNIRLSYAKDPLNIAAVVIMEENHYYPFGLKHTKYNSDTYNFVVTDSQTGDGYYVGIDPVAAGSRKLYQYKYNGKEWQDELSLNVYAYGARDYDPSLGRYFSMDNFSEAFYNINPYQYTANNPVKFIDINGDYIYISDGNGNNYKYSKGKVYAKDKENNWNEYTVEEGSYVAQIVAALNDITQGDENSFGSQFLDLFENKQLNAVFEENTKDNRTVTSGRTIKTSDKQNERVATTEGVKKLTFHITIAHELAHVVENFLFDKKILDSKWFSVNTMNGTRDISIAEIFASTYENMIRAEQGLPLRTHYSLNDNGSVIENSRLIKKSKVNNPFNKQYEPTEQVLKIWNKIMSAKKSNHP